MLNHFRKAGKTLAVVLSVLMIAVLGLASCGNTEAIDAATAKADEALNAANAALTADEVAALLADYASAEDVAEISEKLADFVTSADLSAYAKASVVTSIQNQLNTLTTTSNANKTDVATIKTQLAALQTAVDGLANNTGSELTAAKKEAMTALDDAKAAVAANVYPTAVDATIRETVKGYNDVDILCAVSVDELTAITEAVSVYKNHTSLADAAAAANKLIAAVGAESAVAQKVTLDGTTVTLNIGTVADDMYVEVLVGTTVDHKIGGTTYKEYTVGKQLVAVNKLTTTTILEKKNDSALDEYAGTGALAGKKVLIDGAWYIVDTTLANQPVVHADGTAYTFNTVTVRSGEGLEAAKAAVAAIKADYGKTDGVNTDALNTLVAAYEAALKGAEKAIYEAKTAIKNFVAACDNQAGVKVSRWKASTIIDMLGINVSLSGSKGLTYMTGNTLTSEVTFNANSEVYTKYLAAVAALAKVLDVSKVENYEDFETYVAALNDNLTDAVYEAVEAKLDDFARDSAEAAGVSAKKVTVVVADYAAELEGLSMTTLANFDADAAAYESVVKACAAAIIDRAYFELSAYEEAVETVLGNLVDEDSLYGDTSYMGALNQLFGDLILTALFNGNDEADIDPIYNERSSKDVRSDDIFVYEYVASSGKTKEVTLSAEEDYVVFLPWEEDYDENAVAALEADARAYYDAVVALYNETAAIVTDAYASVENYEVTGTYEAATNAVKAVAGTLAPIGFTYDTATFAITGATNSVAKALSNKLLAYKGEYVLVGGYTFSDEDDTVVYVIGYTYNYNANGDLCTYEDRYDAKYDELMAKYDADAVWADLGATLNYTETVPYPTDNNFSVVLKADITTVSYVPVGEKYSYSAGNVADLYTITITDDMNSDIETYVETSVLDAYKALDAAIVDGADVLTLVKNFNTYINTTVKSDIGTIVTSATYAEFKNTVIEVLADYLDYYETSSRSTEAEVELYNAVEAHINALIAEVEAVEAATSAGYAKALAQILGSAAKFEHNTYYASNLDIMADAKAFAQGYEACLLGNEALGEYVEGVLENLTEAVAAEVEKLETAQADEYTRGQQNFLLNAIASEWTNKILAVTVGNSYTTATFTAPTYATLEAAKAAVDTLYAEAVAYAEAVVAGTYTGVASELKGYYDVAVKLFNEYKDTTVPAAAYNSGITKLVAAELNKFMEGTDKGVVNTTYAQYAGKDATDLGGFTAWLNAIKAIKASFDADDAAALTALFADMDAECDAFDAWKANLQKLADKVTAADLKAFATAQVAKFTFTYTADVTNTYTAKAAFGTNDTVVTTDGNAKFYNKKATEADAKLVKEITWTAHDYTVVTYKADGTKDTTTYALKAWYVQYVELYTALNALTEVQVYS